MIGRAFTIASLLSLAGCAAMPHSGPTRANLVESDRVEHVEVTPELARDLAQAVHSEHLARLDNGLETLGEGVRSPVVRLVPGDELTVALWSFTTTATSSSDNPPDTLKRNELGKYVVDRDGAVTLPYAGKVKVEGMELAQAQRRLDQHFASTGLFRRPSAVISLDASANSGVLVTGAIGNPRLVQWTPGGRTLAQALTEALGDESTLLREDSDMRARAAVEVQVLRGDRTAATMPIDYALGATLPLLPGDRVIVRKEPKVFVTLLGAGVRQNGQFAFARPPVLSDALARASGLDHNVADGHAVFVLRRREGLKPLLYDFAWDRVQGLVAAQQFELADADVIYVSEAPIVSLQKVVGLLFQVALPVQAVK